MYELRRLPPADIAALAATARVDIRNEKKRQRDNEEAAATAQGTTAAGETGIATDNVPVITPTEPQPRRRRRRRTVIQDDGDDADAAVPAANNAAVAEEAVPAIDGAAGNVVGSPITTDPQPRRYQLRRTVRPHAQGDAGDALPVHEDQPPPRRRQGRRATGEGDEHVVDGTEPVDAGPPAQPRRRRARRTVIQDDEDDADDAVPATDNVAGADGAVPAIDGAAPADEHRRPPRRRRVRQATGQGDGHAADGTGPTHAGTPAQATTATTSATDTTCLGHKPYPAKVLFKPSHPLHDTHALFLRKVPVHVRLLGVVPRMPDPADLDSPAANKYYATVLGIFKAYVSSPVPPGMTLQEAYRHFMDEVLPSADPRYATLVKSIINNAQAMHESADRRRAEYDRLRREARARGRDLPDDSRRVYVSDDEGPNTHPDPDAPGHLSDDDGNAGSHEDDPAPGVLPANLRLGEKLVDFNLMSVSDDRLFSLDPESTYSKGAATRCRPAQLSAGTKNAEGVVQGNTNCVSAIKEAVRALRTYSAVDANAMADMQLAASADGALDGLAAWRLRTTEDPLGPVLGIVDAVDAATGDVTELQLAPGDMPPYARLKDAPTIQQTVQLFTLTVKQAVPFILLARAFHTLEEEQKLTDPPSILVLGAPGTGKSRAAHAVNWYCAQHSRPGFYATAAFAWTAALAYNTPVQRALSTHTMFQILVRPQNKIRHGGLSARKVQDYVGTGGIILDEVAYNSLEHLGACSRSTTEHVSPHEGVPEDHESRQCFSARPRLLLGDAGQHTAPGGTPVYKYAADLLKDPNFTPSVPADTKDATKTKKPRSEAKWTEDNSNLAAGFRAFRTCTATIQLTEQRRQDNTPGGRLLQRYVSYFNGRTEVTQAQMEEFVDALQTKVVTDVSVFAKQEPRVVLQRNKPRHRLNTKLLQHLAATKGVRPIVWNAQHRIVVDKKKKAANTLPPEMTPLQHQQCMCAFDETFDHIPADIWYVPGALYIHIGTTGADAGACNKNVVRAVGIVLHPNEPPDNGQGTYRRLQYMPLAVFVKPVSGMPLPASVTSPEFANQFPGAFPVVPMTAQATVSLPNWANRPNDHRAMVKLTIARTNMGLGDAYAVTDFFVQGFSFKDACWIIDLAVGPKNSIHRACLYVLLSRYRSWDDIKLLRPLFPETPNGLRAKERKRVVDAFLKAAKVDPDLVANHTLLEREEANTRAKYADVFELAERLVAARQ